MSETPNNEIPPKKDSAWNRYVKLHVVDPIARQLTQGITPEKVALTLAVGSALALFPILGTTTLLCLIAGIALRLNQPIIQMVNALCTPIHLPIIYGCVRLGNWIFGVPYAHVGIRMMQHMLWDDPKEFFEMFGRTALQAIVAWSIVAPFWMLIIYVLALPVMREILRRQAIASQACTGRDSPTP